MTIARDQFQVCIWAEPNSTFILRIATQRGHSKFPGDPLKGLTSFRNIPGLECVGNPWREDADGEVFCNIKFRMKGSKSLAFSSVESIGPNKVWTTEILIKPVTP